MSENELDSILKMQQEIAALKAMLRDLQIYLHATGIKMDNPIQRRITRLIETPDNVTEEG